MLPRRGRDGLHRSEVTDGLGQCAVQVCVKPDKYTIRVSQPQPKQVDAAAVLELRGVCCCVAPAAVWQLELDDQPDRVLLGFVATHRCRQR